MEEGHPLAAGPYPGCLADDPQARLLDLYERGLDVGDLEGDVMEPWPSLGQVQGDGTVVVGGLQQFDLGPAGAERQMGRADLLGGHLVGLGDLEPQGLPDRPGPLQVLHGQAEMGQAAHARDGVFLFQAHERRSQGSMPAF